MTTETSKFQVNYVKSTEGVDPKILVALHLPLFDLLKLVYYKLTGQSQPVFHCLTEPEIESLSRSIIRWRLVKNLRHYKRHAKQ